ncbi:Fibronectin-binding protein A N-terminus (FbpA) family protein [Babesia bovis T2Bo]|uniref:Ribosome quality control complex subunit 2 n=1 Tax=Babesia bovis TaxID=5865 RepID=A7AVG4_BABBO|nr:Fibronectin-binding protein A N-terminus (FbpA) family protein [Babesia bovis T2Bo]EDO05790.1 Fibronectin-binding protein A N-terminus (FbpA) family protein [Babesia bovis T2Bo]|eukprot:XP_001609358.1 hypothetical protein [Babesia bovis T2Bo]
MVRERLNAVDVAAVVGNLRSQILDYNLVNIYDVTSRVYVLKFSRNEDKRFVLFEIGHRIHTTQFLRTTDKLPSNFNVKLRKHLRTRKLRGIYQIAQDRVVDFTFSSGEYAYHLIVQLFLPGNVYLTDYSYKVLTVLRPQNAGDSFFRVGETYGIPEASVPWNIPVSPAVIDGILSGMGHGNVDASNSQKKVTNSRGKPETGDSSKQSIVNGSDQGDYLDIGSEFKDRSVSMLLKLIFPSVTLRMMRYALVKAIGADICDSDVSAVESSTIYTAVEALRSTLDSLSNPVNLNLGYLYKKGTEYEDFGCFDYGDGWERFDDFNMALDAYFTKSELRKIERKEQPKKPIKLQKIKDDQNRRELEREREVHRLGVSIALVEGHRDTFDTVLDLMRSLVASGASWQEITDQLSRQRDSGHLLARHIRSVNIPDRRVDVCLPNDDPGYYTNVTSMGDKRNKRGSKKSQSSDQFDDTSVTLDYGLTCFQNLEIMYSQKKRMAEKLERTRAGHQFALKRVDREKEKQVKSRGDRNVSLVKVRKRMWFEKFHWFITSDGFLVLGGRDSTQNELLVKRYLTKGDLYFHADVHGAASCILKNPSGNAESFPNTIDEAACFSLCLSSAWSQKMVVPAWWVHHHQVSRSAPSGEYLPHGSFMIRGKKNYVQPQRLEMAIGVVFHIEVPDIDEEEVEAPAGPDTEDAPQDVESDESDASLTVDDLIGHGEEPVVNDDVVMSDESPSSDDDMLENKRVVRFNLDNDTEPKERVGNFHLLRKGTGYPCTGFNPDDLAEKLSALGLIDPDDTDSPESHVRFIEPDKPIHIPEAVERLRKRLPTGIIAPKKPRGPSRLARVKAAKARKKYGDDDEEIQQLRCQLTGSRLLKSGIDTPVVEPVPEESLQPKPVFQRQAIQPLDDRELSSHMRQLRALSKSPSEGDVILSAIPMCAPYGALKSHPYHLKLVPGNNKKGAIASQALSHFLKVDESKSPFIKLITTDQFALTLIENCKVPGLSGNSKR